MRKTIIALTGLAALASIAGCPPRAKPHAQTVTIAQNQEATIVQPQETQKAAKPSAKQQAEAQPAVAPQPAEVTPQKEESEHIDHDGWVKVIMQDEIGKPVTIEGKIDAIIPLRIDYIAEYVVENEGEAAQTKSYDSDFTFAILSVKTVGSRLRLAYVWDAGLAPREDAKITYFPLHSKVVNPSKFAAIAFTEKLNKSTFDCYSTTPDVTIDGIIGNYTNIRWK